MEILFHPSFDRGYYLDWNLETRKLGTKIVGTAGLLDYLSLHNGLSGRFASDGERAASYLADVGKCTKGTWIEKPFMNDSLGVAKKLLDWRDLLMMAGWTPDLRGSEQTPKLQLLARIEECWRGRMKGSSDRWLELSKLAERQPIIAKCDHITCSCAKEQLPRLVQKVLEACHASFAEYPDEVRIQDNLNIKVLHYNDLLDVYRQVAAGKLDGNVFINRDNVSLNHILFSWGKSLLDATIPDSNPITLQLFKLALSVFSRPLNIQNLLSYLQLPVGPIPAKLRHALAKVLIDSGGFGEIDWDDSNMDQAKAQAFKKAGITSKWEQIIWEYVENDDDSSARNKVERESKTIFLRPIFDDKYSHTGHIPVQILRDYIGSINQWAASFAYGKDEEGKKDKRDEELKAQLGTVISYFKQLQETLESKDSISYEDLEKIINTIYQPTTIVQARAQVGSLRVVDSYQQLVDTPESLVWLDCCGTDVMIDPYDFLNAQEREWLNGNKGIIIPQLKDMLDMNRKEMITVLSKIKGSITLVASDYHHNQKMTEHPLIAELKMQLGDSLIIEEGGNDLPLTDSKPIREIKHNLSYQLGPISYAGRSESNTSIDTLINYPFDYTVHYIARLGEPSKEELGTLSKVTGLVAHLFIQNLVNDLQDIPDAERLTAISKLVENEYEVRLEKAVQLTGLALLLKENKAEYNNLRFLLRRSIETLIQIMEHESLIPIGCELKYGKPIFPDNSDFNARIDMELKDAQGNSVIFDFKWSFTAYYGQKIAEGTAIQLELYRKELEQQGKRVKAVGYYLLPKCLLETSDFDTLKDSATNRVIIQHIDPPADSNLFNRIWNSVIQRKKEIETGTIEEGEEMDIFTLPYTQQLLTSDNMLWVGTPKRGRKSKNNPTPPVEKVMKESNKVFVNKPELRFKKMMADFDNQALPNEKPTTYPLLKGRLK